MTVRLFWRLQKFIYIYDIYQDVCTSPPYKPPYMNESIQLTTLTLHPTLHTPHSTLHTNPVVISLADPGLLYKWDYKCTHLMIQTETETRGKACHRERRREKSKDRKSEENTQHAYRWDWWRTSTNVSSFILVNHILIFSPMIKHARTQILTYDLEQSKFTRFPHFQSQPHWKSTIK